MKSIYEIFVEHVVKIWNIRQRISKLETPEENDNLVHKALNAEISRDLRAELRAACAELAEV